MKNRFLIMFLVAIIGASQIHESFSEDYFSTPSCNTGTFVSDHVQCSTGEYPPCQEPSFEKNGYCAIKKIDICEQGTILKNGDCIEDMSVDIYTIERQHLQTGKTISESGTLISMIIGGFGPILIALFIVVYAVKKRMRKNIEEEK
ncbi:hypothetical protein K0U27_04120 [archaeon]|nr:hypothetical protein [archaeon]